MLWNCYLCGTDLVLEKILKKNNRILYIMASSSIKEPVRLRRKNLTNGNVSLYLAIYTNGRREYEFLKLYLIPEKTKADRERNKNTLMLANSIKAKRIVEIQNGQHGFKSDCKEKTLFFDYYISLAEKRKKKESQANFGIWMSCLLHLKKYDSRKDLTFADITPKWIEGFKEYLENKAISKRCRKSKRSTTHLISQNTKQLYFTKLRTCLNHAYDEGIIRTNPLKGISGISKEETERCYLTFDEVKAMAATECEYPEVKRAFLFSCLTGLRRSDIDRLTWGDITVLNGRTRLLFRQKKTGGREYLDISSQAADLIGERGDMGTTEKVFGYFRQPRFTNISLRKWAKKAGVDKDLTFHVGRHTFAVLMLTLGTDLYTVSKLLGHRDIKTTQIYAKIIDAKKQEAVDNIPKIF